MLFQESKSKSEAASDLESSVSCSSLILTVRLILIIGRVALKETRYGAKSFTASILTNLKQLGTSVAKRRVPSSGMNLKREQQMCSYMPSAMSEYTYIYILTERASP